MQCADFECEECGDAKKELHVHHCLYIYEKEPWDYPDVELRSIEHDTYLEWRRLAARLTIDELDFLMANILEAQTSLDAKPAYHQAGPRVRIQVTAEAA